MATEEPPTKKSKTEGGDKAILYSYWRSSSSYRLRIALNLKKIDYEYKAVNLAKGEQLQASYAEVNPMKQVPTLEIDEAKLHQSTAIMEYLEETHPEVPLLPKDPLERAQVRNLVMLIAADTQPVQNLRVLKKHGKEHKMEWGCHFITFGLKGFEQCISKTAGKYCFGDTITMADICLLPQIYNARRYKVDLSQFPTIEKIVATLEAEPAFAEAHPDKQPDAGVAQ